MGSAVDSIVDFGGDVIGGAADVVGDVVGGIGDVVGNVADSLNPATIAAIVYFASTGDPSALFAETGSAAAAETVLADLGEQGFMDLLSTYGSDAAASGEIMGGFESVVDAGSLYGSELGSGSVLTGDISNIINADVNLGDLAFDGPTIPTDIGTGIGTDIGTGIGTDIGTGVGTDVGTQTVGGYTFGADGSILDAAGNVVADAATSSGFTDAGLSLGDIYNYVKGGMNISNLAKLIAGGGSLVGALMPSSGQLGSFFSNLGSAAPLAGAAGLGYLTYKDRANTNKSITDAYNNYLAKQSGISSAYGVGQGPQTLNYNVAGIPLAQAQPRTAAQTVVMPKAAKGGSINDLYSEYSQLNNRMRNYRRLAKGGLI
jgi:hypothetical protein